LDIADLDGSISLNVNHSLVVFILVLLFMLLVDLRKGLAE